MSQSGSHSFRIPSRRGGKPADPESLFRGLSRRSPHIQHLWSHQADVLRGWHSSHVDTRDLALELPTGTGKTLIGLLIGDFVRQTREERVAYMCPNRQLAHQVGALAEEYSIDARVLVGRQNQYDPEDFNAYTSSSAIAITTYSAIFNTNPRIDSANLLILDDAHASEDFIASLWNVEIDRNDQRDIYSALLEFFKDGIPGSQYWNLKSESTFSAQTECIKIPSPLVGELREGLREFLESALTDTNLIYPWLMVKDHLDACHIFVTWPTISIRPITPPTNFHPPFSNSRQRIYMSATLGEGGELERITGVRRIERLPVPEGWDREGTGRRFIIFPDQSLPPQTATMVPLVLAGDPTRSLILTPNRRSAESVIKELNDLSPNPTIFSASDVESTLEPFLGEDHAALVLNNRYDGLDLPGDACRLEWICGLPGATNPQETFLLNRLGVQSLLRDRIRTRLTQALGRCTRNPTDHAVVIITGNEALDFCNKVENRSGFHPELQAEIQYGLDASKNRWAADFLDDARAFLEKKPGWEGVDEWIREERDSYYRLEDKVARTLMDNVHDEIDYADAMWVGDYQRALEKARVCVDRLGGEALADYRAWWCYLAGSAALLSATKDNNVHLREAGRDLFRRACQASPRSTWFVEAGRAVNFDAGENLIDNVLLLEASEKIERRVQQFGVVGAAFENEVQEMIDLLDSEDATPFERGLEHLGLWLGYSAVRPPGTGVPDGVWPFAEDAIVSLEAKSNESPDGPISLRTAREARAHINWVKSNMRSTDTTSLFTVILTDRTTISADAVPNTEALYVVSLGWVRALGRRVAAVVRALRAQASGDSNEDFRQVIAARLKEEKLDPVNILTELQHNPLSVFPVQP